MKKIKLFPFLASFVITIPMFLISCSKKQDGYVLNNDSFYKLGYARVNQGSKIYYEGEEDVTDDLSHITGNNLLDLSKICEKEKTNKIIISGEINYGFLIDPNLSVEIIGENNAKINVSSNSVLTDSFAMDIVCGSTTQLLYHDPYLYSGQLSIKNINLTSQSRDLLGASYNLHFDYVSNTASIDIENCILNSETYYSYDVANNISIFDIEGSQNTNTPTLKVKNSILNTSGADESFNIQIQADLTYHESNKDYCDGNIDIKNNLFNSFAYYGSDGLDLVPFSNNGGCTISNNLFNSVVASNELWEIAAGIGFNEGTANTNLGSVTITNNLMNIYPNYDDSEDLSDAVAIVGGITGLTYNASYTLSNNNTYIPSSLSNDNFNTYINESEYEFKIISSDHAFCGYYENNKNNVITSLNNIENGTIVSNEIEQLIEKIN